MSGEAGSLWTDRWNDYAKFHRLALWTGDVDPAYPVLRKFSTTHSARGQAWLGFLHVAFYDMGSALRAYSVLGGERPDETKIGEVLKYPTGTERRAHRNPPNLARHLSALMEMDRHFGGLDQMLLESSEYHGQLGRLLSIWGNGRWAAYKTCELMSHAMAPYYPVAAGSWMPTDMGHAHSSGPRHGLELLSARPLPHGNGPTAVAWLNGLSDALVRDLQLQGLPASAATAETTLCDFHSLAKGRYYVGHDIDQLGDQLRRALATVEATGNDAVQRLALLRAITWSLEVFGRAYWPHVTDKARRKAYLETGEMVVR